MLLAEFTQRVPVSLVVLAEAIMACLLQGRNYHVYQQCCLLFLPLIWPSGTCHNSVIVLFQYVLLVQLDLLYTNAHEVSGTAQGP